MIRLETHYFTKIAEDASNSLYDECMSLLQEIKDNGKNIVTGSVPPAQIKKTSIWSCFANEAKESNNTEALQALKSVLLEAKNYFATNQNQQYVNLEQLASKDIIYPHIVKMGLK